MELVDTHAHLYVEPLAASLDDVLARARAASVTRIVVPCDELASWPAVDRLASRPGLAVAYGLHPWMADEPLVLAELAERLSTRGAVAVGEIGLDFAIEHFDRERQLALLRDQLGVAVELGLPVLLHCSSAFEELAALLRPFVPRLRGVLHAFSRGPELAQRFLDLGLHLAFGGAITRSGAKRARRAAAMVPWDRIVLETDAPAIGLAGVEPQDVEPRHVADIARALAELRGESLEVVAERTTANAIALLGLR